MRPELLELLKRTLEELQAKEKMVEILNEEIFLLKEREGKLLAELEQALEKGEVEPQRRKILIGAQFLLIPHRLASGRWMIELRRSAE